jgi:hypothetical protein
LKSGEGVRGILHGNAFGFRSKKKERMAAGQEKQFDGIPHFSFFDESGTHATLTPKNCNSTIGLLKDSRRGDGKVLGTSGHYNHRSIFWHW